MSSLSLDEELQTVIFLLKFLVSLSFHLPSGVGGVIQPWGSWSSGCES